MSQRPTNLRSDVARLLDDGYEVSIEYGHLVMRGVPYVNASRQVKRGILVSTLPGSITEQAAPDTHQVWFSGEFPCDVKGRPLTAIGNASQRHVIGGDLTVDHHFSSKPKSGQYRDHFEKMTTYATILESPAAAIELGATARTGRVIASYDDSPFQYFDNASGRASITAITNKLRMKSVAIIGLGGTGSYVLDFVAKTPVEEIHLIDGDVFEQHNAFRAPGASSFGQLQQRLKKVDHYAQIYSSLHRGIVPHPGYVDEESLELLEGHDMVFVCIDANEMKPRIIEALESAQTPFIDVGMGIDEVDGGLTGQLRTTVSTPNKRHHVHDRRRIPLTPGQGDNVYSRNIQVCELNAMNACLAVVRWKKMFGFYRDTEREHFSIYTIDGNHLLNEDRA